MLISSIAYDEDYIENGFDLNLEKPYAAKKPENVRASDTIKNHIIILP